MSNKDGKATRSSSANSTHRAARISDVARQAGVSTATVSRVLNGATNVAAEKIEAVEAAALALNYVRNPNGRALRRQQSDMWAVIVPDLQNPFFISLVESVERVAVANGYSVMLCNTSEKIERESAYIDAAIAQRMAGAVVCVASEGNSSVAKLMAAEVPTVVVDRRVHDFEGDTLLLDNVRAGEMAIEHLFERGLTRILCLAGPRGVSTTEDRLQGVLAAHTKAGIAFDAERQLAANLKEGDVESVLAGANLGEEFDAIFAFNGPLTAGAFMGLQMLGMAVPSQISLLGFDDVPWTRMVTPTVTLIAQPVEDMGERAGGCLLARGRGEQSEPTHALLAPRLEVRSSTAPRARV